MKNMELIIEKEHRQRTFPPSVKFSTRSIHPDLSFRIISDSLSHSLFEKIIAENYVPVNALKFHKFPVQASLVGFYQ